MTTKQVKSEQGEQQNTPPWPEWSDTYINTLQWYKMAKHTVYTSPSSNKLKTFVPTFEQVDDYYEDPVGLVKMPSDMHVHCWKRPHQISTNVSHVMEPDPVPLDLVTHNRHLLGYEIMEKIISNIGCLERESYHRPFPIEFQSDQFVAVGGAEWKPWHHVYAFTLAGKGQTHKLQYNPYGKYVVRLFFLGKWRRILVDDRLPLDEQGQVLLPMSRPDNLWLPLLSKALLKVACLSWLPSTHCVDFNIIHCLTGWIPTEVPCKGCSVYHLWCICCQLMPTTEEVVLSPGCCKNNQELGFQQDEYTGHSAAGSRAILAIMTPLGSQGPVKKELPLSKSYSKQMIVQQQTVLISNVKYDNEQPRPLWKQYRWNEWAYNKGIISEIPHKPDRSIQIYNPCEACTKMSVNIYKPAENEVWMDFEVFVQNVRTFDVYYKPSYFKYSLRAWSEEDLLLAPHVAEDVVIKSEKRSIAKEKGGGDSKSKKSKSPKTEKSTDLLSKPPSQSGTPKGKGGKVKEDKEKVEEEYPKSLRKASFFYVLIDSMASKEVLLSLSVYSPEGTPYAIMFVGKFEWHSPSVAPIIERMSTTATCASFFLLPPGLRVFRIWHQFPDYFCLQIFSNTNFKSGTKMFIQKSLSSDSISYQIYGKEISSSFEQLLMVPQGGSEHGKAFQQLMSSLDPPHLSTQLPWPDWYLVHIVLLQAFEDSLVEMLINSIHQSDDLNQTIETFQLLFLNPVFGLKSLKSIKPEYYEYIMEQRELKRQKELLLEQELREKLSQTKELKGNKGAKSDKSRGKPSEADTVSKPAKTKDKIGKKDKDKPMLVIQGEQLRKLIRCKEKNLLINDPTQAILLLKKMMSKVPHLRYLYPFRFEDDIKLVYKDYTGEIHTTEKWVVLVRCVLNIHSTEPVPCSLHIWSPVKNLVLRLINNDTDEEIMPLGFVENNVAYLTRNNRGYTAYAYGVTHKTPIPWRLRSMGMRETDCLHVCEIDEDKCTNSHITPPEQYQQTLHGYYVPNKQNIIASCLLEVYADVTVVLRLQVNHRYALCRLTVTDEAGELVVDTCGMGCIMVVALNLKGSSAESVSGEVTPLIYRVAATLLNNSWPLTLPQMIAMLHYKEQLPASLKQPEKNSLERTTTTTEKQTSSRSSRLSPNKLPEDQKLVHFEDVQKKPSWSLTLVTDLQKEMPVTLRLDTSLYDLMNKLNTQWKNDGFDLNNFRLLRQNFLDQISGQSHDSISEETFFKLKPKKLDKLTELYGRKVSYDWLQDHNLSRESLVSSEHTLITNASQHTLTNMSQHLLTTMSDNLHPSVKNMVKSSTKSLQARTSEEQSTSSIEDASVHEVKLDHTNMCVQQAGIHKALQNIREKTMEHNQRIFKETTIMREKILTDIKLAKDAELEADQSKPEKKKGKNAKDLSPKDIKSKKGSVKNSKKPKGKGK